MKFGEGVNQYLQPILDWYLFYKPCKNKRQSWSQLDLNSECKEHKQNTTRSYALMILPAHYLIIIPLLGLWSEILGKEYCWLYQAKYLTGTLLHRPWEKEWPSWLQRDLNSECTPNITRKFVQFPYPTCSYWHSHNL